MGRRALVAYRRPDARYDVHYSHWGGERLSLVTALSADAPLADGAVDVDPLAVGVSLECVLACHLDPCTYEALYLVSPDVALTPYRVCWLEWGDGRDSDRKRDRDRGAIVPVEPGGRDHEVRAWFRAIKTTLSDLCEMGAIRRQAATAYLEARVCEDEHGHVYTYRRGPSSDDETCAKEGDDTPDDRSR
ncbi:DUF6735 family protein [Natrialbaceae archaeon AArc-T1-2]|uniref:DUF6735 family protein n=1 Tax=Natrialbaceae archaeon AArc-T1-2 TaxID=3053904 RepID=UPI00255B16AE|nr:DUF6735 family protein [Natrialbaceae archaeon AArc-T1-2]WIV67581.1 hypothetical protein QQ977_02290 [Natrialbaceae archaeon AArc-T1-2]